MKRSLLVVPLLLAAAALGPAQPPAGHDLTVSVADVRTKDGVVVVALFAKADGFPAEVGMAAVMAKVSPERPTHTFANLPAGKYAVVVFHDRNQDGKLDRTAFGLPKEPIGLSNHPAAGRPDFEKAKVAVAKATSVTVNLVELGK